MPRTKCQRGGATNSFNKILTKLNITNPRELETQFDFYSANAHGSLNGNAFIVPDNTYILFFANASKILAKQIYVDDQKDQEYDEVIYNKPSQNDSQWYEHLYKYITRGHFFKSMMYPDSQKDMICTELQPITSIYEPGDVVQDLNLVFEDTHNQTNSGLWGLWKLPVPNDIYQKFNEINYEYKTRIDEYKKKIESTIDKIRGNVISKTPENYDSLEKIMMVESIIQSIYKLDYMHSIDMIRNKVGDIKGQIRTVFTNSRDPIYNQIDKEIMPLIVEFVETIVTIAVERSKKPNDKFRKVEEGIVEHPNQFIGKIVGQTTDYYGSTINKRILSGITKLSQLLNGMARDIPNQKPFKFIIVYACRSSPEVDKAPIQRSLSVGVRESDQYTRPALSRRGINVDDVNITDLYLPFKAGDIAYIIDIDPRINGLPVMIVKHGNNLGRSKNITGYNVQYIMDLNGDDPVRMAIKTENLSKISVPSTVVDQVEATRLQPSIERIEELNIAYKLSLGSTQ